MMDESLHQPHDKLFHATFRVPENTAGLLKETLPAELSSHFDWSQLQLLSGSFVDPQFQRSHTDLTFSVPLEGHETLLYLLFEHQSTRDPWLSLRLLRYMVNLWEDYLRRNPKATKLPAILPVVLSQNAGKWEKVPDLEELVDLPEAFRESFRAFVPSFTHQHLQLAEMNMEQIPGTPSGIYVLRAMKAERLGRLLDELVWEEALMNRVPENVLLMVLRYILGADIDKEAFENKVKEINKPRIREKAMTLAQAYHQEGRQEGRQEGKAEGLQDGVLESLSLRFGELPAGLVEKVRECRDMATLRTYLRNSIQCQSLEDFAGGM